VNIRAWYERRGLGYAVRRAGKLLSRYGLTPRKAARRAEACVATLAQYGCAPTFPTPASVVRRYPRVMRRLQDAGAEIAVHGYDHVDYTTYRPAEASEQLLRAKSVFSHEGIDACGFRCPYLGCTEGLRDTLPQGSFGYSSNHAVSWDVVPRNGSDRTTVVFDVLDGFYRSMPAAETVCTPRTRPNLVEIPVSLPDDLQLHDGLQLQANEMADVWSKLLHQNHERGELFVLQFHPELAATCQQPFEILLHEASVLSPGVWVARLRDVSDWWREKADFIAAVSADGDGVHIEFTASPRATVLVRGIEQCANEPAWDDTYRQLTSATLDLPGGLRPFVGLPADAPEPVRAFLEEQGYVLDITEKATQCGIYLDYGALAQLANEVEFIRFIERSAAPLVKFGRWPDGAKSAMCITGDLDALTLIDYAAKLFVR